MPVSNHPDLDAAAQRKCDEGCRAALKAVADAVVSTDNSAGIVKAIDFFNGLGLFAGGAEAQVVVVNQALLVFRKPKDEVDALVAGLTPVSVPDKVVSKMVASRVAALVDRVRDANEKIAENNAYVDDLVAKGQPVPQWRTRTDLIPVPSEIRTVDALRAFAEVFGSAGPPRMYIRGKTAAMKAAALILAKPGLRDDHVSGAWDILEVRDVLSS